jgi:hypothetical protein
MVRSGAYRGVPLYARTTLEPYSIVFVPVSGGVMQPYERRRDGDIAGTVGTTTPGLPVVVPTRSDAPGGMILQAAAPPVVTDTRVPPESEPAPVTASAPAAPGPVGTSGRAEPAPRRPYEPLIKPSGLDAAYVEFNGQRWFPKGNAVSLEGMAVTQIGDHHGFPVFAAGPGATTIYIPVTRDTTARATPFSRRR